MKTEAETATASATAPAGTARRRVALTLPDGTTVHYGSKNATHVVIGWIPTYDIDRGEDVTRWTVIRNSNSGAAAAKLARYFDPKVRAHVVEIA